MPNQRKIDIVEKLKDKVRRAKSMVFTNYQGLTHRQLETLKKAVKTADSDFVTTKNTLIKQAGGPDLEGPTATLFVYGEVIAPLKELAKTIKLLKLPVIKFALIDGKNVTGEEVLKLASLPSREVLLAQLVGGMKTPIYGLHRAMSWNLQKLVVVLKAIESKGGDNNGKIN